MKPRVPWVSPEARADTLRRNLVHMHPDLRARAERRIAVLEDRSNTETADVLAKPLVDRAPALARWAEKVQQDRSKSPLERAAAYEFEALAWEEVGHFDAAFRARAHAATELGAVPDVAGFHTEPNARW